VTPSPGDPGGSRARPGPPAGHAVVPGLERLPISPTVLLLHEEQAAGTSGRFQAWVLAGARTLIHLSLRPAGPATLPASPWDHAWVRTLMETASTRAATG